MNLVIRRRTMLATTLLVCSPLLTRAQLHSQVDYSQGPRAWPNFTNVFKVPQVPPADFGNSPRLDELVRGGKLYLSLQDAIALAIENNLGMAVARYRPQIANADILRAKSGATLRGIQTQIEALSTGLSAVSGTGGAEGGQATGITGTASSGGGGASAVGDVGSFFGTQAANLDPVLSGSISWGHFSRPQTSNFVTGTNTLISESTFSQIGVSKGFLSGATMSVGWANSRNDTNLLRNNFNPTHRGDLTLSFNQPLMRGFGFAVNSRSIVVARNNREISDLVFENQVITTVAGVQTLYWDLVALRAQAESEREALRLAQKLYDDNQVRLKIGTIAPIDVVTSEVEVAQQRQGVMAAERRVKEQESVLKNTLSKNGLASPSLLEVEVIPTDELDVPEVLGVQPIQDLMTLALQRPDMSQSRINLNNKDLGIRNVRDALRPSVDLTAYLGNNSLAGGINEDFQGLPGENLVVSDFFVGGLGTSLGQLFRRNFPDYQIGLRLNIPLKNRRAQADMTAELLEKRQLELQLRQKENDIREEVNRAVIGLQEAHAQSQVAKRTRELRETLLEGVERQFALGKRDIFIVVEYQRALAQSRLAEINMANSYVQARANLDRITGRTLEANHILVEEAYEGRMSRLPDPLPADRQP